MKPHVNCTTRPFAARRRVGRYWTTDSYGAFGNMRRTGLILRDAIPFFQKTVFHIDATAVMIEAYEKACQSLYDVRPSDTVKDLIACRIIEAALTGERNPDTLCESAIQALELTLLDPR